ncbi:MAG TPA: 2OG-Fe(II) oxygenase family protein, partial [Ilumatobacteraceae bacterium]|nr:2OG-Fe(II) oxygenase family protein [Ilumatobacteraceae bacterium]
MNASSTVDVVDFQAPDAPIRFTRSLHETGFAVLVNHPLPVELVQSIYDEWLAFFDTEAKEAYRFSDDNQDGYFAPEVSETAKGNDKRDIKEFFHVYPWGRYPTEVSEGALRYAEQAKAIAQTLLGWVDDNTPPEVAARFSRPLRNMMNDSTRSLLRILRYPPLRGDEEPGAVRAAAHEDINLLTVLPASNEAGLQVQDTAGNWHDVPCDFGSLAINCGDMLDLASGGYYPSTTHRVTNPTGEAATRSRLSLPLFLHPADDVVLAEGRTAFSFLQERLRELRSQDLKAKPGRCQRPALTPPRRAHDTPTTMASATVRSIDGALIRRGRADLIARDDLSGRTLARRLSDQMDGWIDALAHDLPADWSVIATGGYATGLLSPGSDIDVVLLHPPKTPADTVRAVAESIWYPMWDSGVKLAPAAHSQKSLLSLAADDLHTATTLLRVRPLAGSAEQAAAVRTAAREQWRKRSHHWLTELRAASKVRWAKAGDVAALLEPDLKDGAGGLRDYDT